jgi:hypothetical protein
VFRLQPHEQSHTGRCRRAVSRRQYRSRFSVFSRLCCATAAEPHGLLFYMFYILSLFLGPVRVSYRTCIFLAWLLKQNQPSSRFCCPLQLHLVGSHDQPPEMVKRAHAPATVGTGSRFLTLHERNVASRMRYRRYSPLDDGALRRDGPVSPVPESSWSDLHLETMTWEGVPTAPRLRPSVA